MQNSLDTSNASCTFVSSRFCFSLLNNSHREFYYSLYSNKTVMEKIAEPLSRTALSGLFQRVLKHNKLGLLNKSKSLNWVICDLANNQNVGIQGFAQNANHSLEAEFGIMLSLNSHQKGIANESITAMISYGFLQMEFDKLYANYTIENRAIQRIAENLNFNISNTNNQTSKKYCWLTKQQFVERLPLFERQQNEAR